MIKYNIKKLFNFRGIFFLFIIGLLCVYFTYKTIFNIYFILGFIIPIILVLFTLVSKKFIFTILSSLFLLFIILYTFVFITNNLDNRFNDKSQLFITGKISSINIISNDFSYLTLTNVRVVDESQNSYSLNGNLSISTNTSNIDFDLKQYYEISFSSSIAGVNLFNENYINTFYLKNNIRYQTKTTISANNINILGDASTLPEKIKEHNRILLVDVFGETNGNLAFASLYGDKSFSDEELLNEFRLSGVAHIFTVSGLHISLIVLVINFFLSKSNQNNISKFFINLVILFIFCLLCNFSPSVIRASIMALVMITSKIFGRKYDVINSLSLAGIILLIINPFNTFDIGFQMTFAAVFGIVMFNSLFKKIKIENKTLNKIYFAFATSLGAQLGLLPIFAQSYGYISTWSVFANIFIIPMFSLFYSILFVFNWIILILPFLKFIYFIPNIILSFVIRLNTFVCSLPYGMIYLNKFGFYLSYLYYLNMYILSKYFVVTLKYNLIIAILIYSIISYGVIAGTKSRTSTQNQFIFFNSSSSLGTLLETKDNKFYLINPDLNKTNSIVSNLIDLKIYNLSGIFVLQEDLSYNAYTIYQNLKGYNPIFYVKENSNLTYSLNKLGLNAVEVEDKDILNINNTFKVDYYYFDYDNDLDYEVTAINFIFNDIQTIFFDGLMPQNFYISDYIEKVFNFKIDCARIYDSENHIFLNNIDCGNMVYDSRKDSFYVLGD